jgi:hypothetical protein
MIDHRENREEIVSYLRYELVGPWDPWGEGRAVLPVGEEIDTEREMSFADAEAAYGPFVQSGTRQEILQRDRPCKRYGVGVLYPLASPIESEEVDLEATPTPEAGLLPEDSAVQPLTANGEEMLRRIAERRGKTDPDSDDFDLKGANEYRPSVMAVSFLAELPQDSQLCLELKGGRYARKKVTVSGKDRSWWLRSPVSVTAAFDAPTLRGGENRVVRPEPTNIEAVNIQDLPLEITAFTRPRPDGSSLLTISVINRSTPPPTGGPDEQCLFQARFRAARWV